MQQWQWVDTVVLAGLVLYRLKYGSLYGLGLCITCWSYTGPSFGYVGLYKGLVQCCVRQNVGVCRPSVLLCMALGGCVLIVCRAFLGICRANVGLFRSAFGLNRATIALYSSGVGLFWNSVVLSRIGVGLHRNHVIK